MSDLNTKGSATVCLQGTALELTLLGQRINAYVIALDIAQFSLVGGGGLAILLSHPWRMRVRGPHHRAREM